jgi:hypothetical protein
MREFSDYFDGKTTRTENQMENVVYLITYVASVQFHRDDGRNDGAGDGLTNGRIWLGLRRGDGRGSLPFVYSHCIG